MTGTREELKSLLSDERALGVLVFFLGWRMETEAFRDTLTIVRYTTGRPSAVGTQLCHSDLIRDLVGPLPFRPVRLDPSWLTSAVVGLATTIYEQRSFDLMPVLGTALSDAGCTDPGILGHCATLDHWRGCWLTDLLLKKE
jgi:hypothetical protein